MSVRSGSCIGPSAGARSRARGRKRGRSAAMRALSGPSACTPSTDARTSAKSLLYDGGAGRLPPGDRATPAPRGGGFPPRHAEERPPRVEPLAARGEPLLPVELPARGAVELLAAEVGAADGAVAVHLEQHRSEEHTS